MDDAIPEGALGTFIAVIVYSCLCLFASILLVVMLNRHGERFSYVTLAAILLCTSTLTSIIQQIHYACKWRDIAIAGFAKSQQLHEFPGLAALGVAETGQKAMFYIQNYCYNVISVLVLFWCIELSHGVWAFELHFIRGKEKKIATTAKVFAFVIPFATQIAIQTPAVKRSLVSYIIVGNILLAISLTIGSVILGSTLWKYLDNRRKLASIQSSSEGTGEFSDSRLARRIERRRRRDEYWLIVRFTIAFTILGIWEVCIFFYELVQVRNSQSDTARQSPDFSIGRAKSDILTFLPGVSASLIFWLVFGTTAPYRRDYVKFFRSMCGCCLKKRQSRPFSDYVGGPNDFELRTTQPTASDSMFSAAPVYKVTITNFSKPAPGYRNFDPA